MMKKVICGILAVFMLLCLAGCSETGSVSVQRADALAQAGLAQERYAGMVVSENLAQIQRDPGKTILETYVVVGQEVKAGDKLFTYDSAALELDLEKVQLEMEKLKNDQQTYNQQLEDLNKQLSWTYDTSTQVKLTLEINTLETQLMQIDYDMATKDAEILKLQDMLNNVDIVSPVDGTVRAVDDSQEAMAYITVQQSGAYRIKGKINELSMGAVMEGTRMKIISRVDSSQFWLGTVALIDLENTDSDDNNSNYYYGYSDPMTSSTSYPFYVTLDSTEGLLMGQHVYMEVYAQEAAMPGLWLPEQYLEGITVNEETGEMTAGVYVAGSGDKLEYRTVTLGMQDYATGCYEVLSGLSGEDYVADPGNPGTEPGAAVTYREPADFTG